jgi:hypothetical protein
MAPAVVELESAHVTVSTAAHGTSPWTIEEWMAAPVPPSPIDQREQALIERVRQLRDRMHELSCALYEANRELDRFREYQRARRQPGPGGLSR